MTVIEIIKEYLEKNGYDGLVFSIDECGCGIDDLCPCTENNLTLCVPAYKKLCKDCDEKLDCHMHDEGQTHCYHEAKL